jgi:hypothetical protein
LGFNGGSSLAGGGLVGLVGNCGGEYMTVVEMVVLLVVAGVRLTGLMLLEDDEDAAEREIFGSVLVFWIKKGKGDLLLLRASSWRQHTLNTTFMLSLEQRPPMRRCRSSFDEVAEIGILFSYIFIMFYPERLDWSC